MKSISAASVEIRMDTSLSCSVMADPSHLQSDGPHQLNAIALRHDALAQLEIEAHSAVFEKVLEVDIVQGACRQVRNIGQCQVVRADESDRATLEEPS